MTSSHGRRIQGRRALAIMAWVTLVIVAGLLWYGQHKRIIRIQAWEPAALLLSAYAAFLAIFGWLLFSPGRQSAEESPGLFFAGMLTLLPPCFIAYHLMPIGSPLKPWLTIGVFIFGIIAIMSPIPPEVFAVPRDRRTYLQPLTNAYLSELDVEVPAADFQDLAPRTAYWLSQPAPDPLSVGAGEARDPWVDPFYGTGRQMSRIGVSQSRRSDESTRNDRRRLSDPLVGIAPYAASKSSLDPPPLPTYMPASASARTPITSSRSERSERSERESLDLHDRSVGVSQPLKPPSSVSPVSQSIPLPPLTMAGPRTDTNLRSPAESPRPSAGSSPASQPLTGSSRRPLTEPSGRAVVPVGFQTPQPVPGYREPPVSPSVVPAPLPFPIASPALNAVPVTAAAATAAVAAAASQAVVSSSVAIPPAPRTPLAPQLATNAPMPDLMRAITRADEGPPLREPAALRPAELKSAEYKPSLSAARDEIPASPRKTSDLSLRELDQQIREEESSLAETDSITSGSDDRSPRSATSGVTDSVTTTSSQQLSNDIRLERIRDEHGGEMIEGTIKVFFEQGQKRAHLHVPFSPPLAGLPEVECEPTGDDPIRLKVAVRQPYGVRIEARRAEANEPLRTEISFAAVYTPTSRG